jgi:hypothetical protein
MKNAHSITVFYNQNQNVNKIKDFVILSSKNPFCSGVQISSFIWWCCWGEFHPFCGMVL